MAKLTRERRHIKISLSESEVMIIQYEEKKFEKFGLPVKAYHGIIQYTKEIFDISKELN